MDLIPPHSAEKASKTLDPTVPATWSMIKLALDLKRMAKSFGNDVY